MSSACPGALPSRQVLTNQAYYRKTLLSEEPRSREGPHAPDARTVHCSWAARHELHRQCAGINSLLSNTITCPDKPSRQQRVSDNASGMKIQCACRTMPRNGAKNRKSACDLGSTLSESLTCVYLLRAGMHFFRFAMERQKCNAGVEQEAKVRERCCG